MNPAKRATEYQPGQEPDYWDPDPEVAGHRFALGRIGGASAAQNPLIVIAMNPSHADHMESDRTVNRVIAASSQLGHDGWLMLNLYPERQTRSSELTDFDPGLWAENWAAIEGIFERFAVTEVFGAWGNPQHATIRESLKRTLAALSSRGTRVYYFGDLTKSGWPRHPMPRNTPWEPSGSKRYLI